MTPDCRHDGNQLAPGALGAQPAAHLPPRARSVTQGVVENGYALVFSVLSPPPRKQPRSNCAAGRRRCRNPFSRPIGYSRPAYERHSCLIRQRHSETRRADRTGRMPYSKLLSVTGWTGSGGSPPAPHVLW